MPKIRFTECDKEDTYDTTYIPLNKNKKKHKAGEHDDNFVNNDRHKKRRFNNNKSK